MRERYLHFEEPLIDVDKLFELWPKTMALGGFPDNQYRPGGSPRIVPPSKTT